VPNISVVDAQKNLKKSLEKGIMKILSKMGISLLQCYHGAQVSVLICGNNIFLNE
jgi:glutamate synthase (ferredoxin)